MTAPEQPSVITASPAKSRSRVNKWLLVNVGVLIATVAASVLILILTNSSTHAPTARPTKSTATVSGFVAFQAGNSLFVNGTASRIPPGDTVWLVFRPLNGRYLPLTPVKLGQSGIFGESVSIYSRLFFRQGAGFLYAVLCNRSANLILEESLQVGIPSLPGGAVILAVQSIAILQP